MEFNGTTIEDIRGLEIHNALETRQSQSETSIISFSPNRNRYESINKTQNSEDHLSFGENENVSSIEVNTFDLIVGNESNSTENVYNFKLNEKIEEKENSENFLEEKFGKYIENGKSTSEQLLRSNEQILDEIKISQHRKIPNALKFSTSGQKPHQRSSNHSSSVNTQPSNTKKLRFLVETSSPKHNSNSNIISTSLIDNRSSSVRTLLPPQRLAIPIKSNSKMNIPSTTNHTHSRQEKEPLVQWADSDDSEEELSFFKKEDGVGIGINIGCKSSRITDNLSIDNLCLSEEDEEEDLHLAVPVLKPNKKCPCDPTPFIQSYFKRAQEFNCHIT